MKKYWLFPLLAVAMLARAQSFEGTITWSMKYDMADTAKKAEMDRAQQRLNDPANQAKLKKLQEQMSTPEMKTMMENNPQLKSQMEHMLTMLQAGSAIAAIPKGFTVKIKNNSSHVTMDGGIIATEMLYQADKDRSYRLDRAAKTYSVIAPAAAGAHRPDSIKHTVTKTNENRIILGYHCTKYTVDLTDRGTTTRQVFWTTTEIKGLDMRNFSRQQTGNGNQAMYYEGLAGVPLRIEMTSPQISMVMEATGVTRASLPASDFIVPADFKEVKGFGG